MTNTILTYKIYSYSPPDILLYLFIYLFTCKPLYIFTLVHRIKYYKKWDFNKVAAVNFTFFSCVKSDGPIWLTETSSGLYLKRIYVKFDGYLVVFCLSIWNTMRIKHMIFFQYFKLFRPRMCSILYLYMLRRLISCVKIKEQ